MEIKSGMVCLLCKKDVMISSPKNWSEINGPKPIWAFCKCQLLKLTDSLLSQGYPCQESKQANDNKTSQLI
jgi:hypothetical protein